jgi:hypothetical protein
MKNGVFWDVTPSGSCKNPSSTKQQRFGNLIRFEVFMAVTMKNVVLWDIKTHFIPHRKHVSATEPSCVRFVVFTVVTMENVVFWAIKTQFVPYRKHITSPLGSPVG